MHSERSYRGWIVTFTVAGVVTYLVLSVERDFRLTHKHAQKGAAESMFPLSGIWLGTDPNVALTPQNKPALSVQRNWPIRATDKSLLATPLT